MSKTKITLQCTVDDEIVQVEAVVDSKFPGLAIGFTPSYTFDPKHAEDKYAVYHIQSNLVAFSTKKKADCLLAAEAMAKIGNWDVPKDQIADKMMYDAGRQLRTMIFAIIDREKQKGK